MSDEPKDPPEAIIIPPTEAFLKDPETDEPDESEAPEEKKFGREETRRKLKQFLEIYSQLGNRADACRMVGLNYHTFWYHKNNNPKFKAKFERANEIATDILEKEAWRRAHDGVEEPIMYKGEPVAFVRKYSDRLMEILLMGNRPEKYGRTGKFELTGKDGKDLNPEVNEVDLARRIAWLMAKATRTITGSGSSGAAA